LSELMEILQKMREWKLEKTNLSLPLLIT